MLPHGGELGLHHGQVDDVSEGWEDVRCNKLDHPGVNVVSPCGFGILERF